MDKMKVILSTPPSKKSSSSSSNSLSGKLNPTAFSPPPSPLTARSRLARWKDFLECSPGKALAAAPYSRGHDDDDGGGERWRRKRNFFDYVTALMLVLALCLFLAFVAWMAIFTRRKMEDASRTGGDDQAASSSSSSSSVYFGDDYGGRGRGRPFSLFDRT